MVSVMRPFSCPWYPVYALYLGIESRAGGRVSGWHDGKLCQAGPIRYLEQLGDHLRLLGFVTGNVTGGGQRLETKNPATPKHLRGKIFEWARRDSNARPLAPEASALSN